MIPVSNRRCRFSAALCIVIRYESLPPELAIFFYFKYLCAKVMRACARVTLSVTRPGWALYLYSCKNSLSQPQQSPAARLPDWLRQASSRTELEGRYSGSTVESAGVKQRPSQHRQRRRTVGNKEVCGRAGSASGQGDKPVRLLLVISKDSFLSLNFPLCSFFCYCFSATLAGFSKTE